MERTLQILDYAIIVVNGMDGIQSHSETIWQLLAHYHVPTFIFVNKMDQTTYHQEELLLELTQNIMIIVLIFLYQKISFLKI